MSSHPSLYYKPTDCEHICCFVCLLFSNQDICLYRQSLFYVPSLLGSNKTTRSIAFGWSLKKYQVPIICLLSSCDIVRAQLWGTESYRAAHRSQQPHQLGPVLLPLRVQGRLRRQLGPASTQGHQSAAWGWAKARLGHQSAGKGDNQAH